MPEERFPITALPQVAQSLWEAGKTQSFWAFEGELGSGKTTLIKELASLMGVYQAVQSPTFALVHEYPTHAGPVFHFDFYRLQSSAELYELGWEDYLAQARYCLVEWAERFPELWPAERMEVRLEHIDEQTRQIAWKSL